MSRIIKVQHIESKKTYALVHVLLDDGTEATTYVGGDVQVYFDKGTVKAFVKRTKSIDMPDEAPWGEPTDSEIDDAQARVDQRGQPMTPQQEHLIRTNTEKIKRIIEEVKNL